MKKYLYIFLFLLIPFVSNAINVKIENPWLDKHAKNDDGKNVLSAHCQLHVSGIKGKSFDLVAIVQNENGEWHTDKDGYNIYRDKTLIDSVDADTHSYVDTPHDFGIYTWQISALYSAGESPLSNAITVTTADVAKVLGDEATSFDIFTIDGIVVGTGLDRIPELDPGIYIINNVKIRIVK